MAGFFVTVLTPLALGNGRSRFSDFGGCHCVHCGKNTGGISIVCKSCRNKLRSEGGRGNQEPTPVNHGPLTFREP